MELVYKEQTESIEMIFFVLGMILKWNYFVIVDQLGIIDK
jgi:hypothetical protein